MKYQRVLITRPGGPEVLQIVKEELPEPKPGQVRVKTLAAGVSYADLLMREGVHPETPRPPFTPGWDLVGVVDRLGAGVTSLEVGQMVTALPITGGYAEFICLPQQEVVPINAGLDPAETVSLVFNYLTAYQMLHSTARVQPGQSALIHAASGGIGTALLQLGRLVELQMYGTASGPKHELVSSLGGIPLDYKQGDFVEHILRLTGDGVHVVFDGIGGTHLWGSFKTLRSGGKVIAYGFTSSLQGGRLAGGQRYRLRGMATIGFYMVAAALLPGHKRVMPYSIQTLKRLKPAWFREDLTRLVALLDQGKIKPIIAERMPLVEAARAHELLGKGSVLGKIVLLSNP
jgi:NADPH2:quinone reductase